MNVPALRFPEFEGEWEEKPFSHLIASHNSGVYKSKDLYGSGTNIVGVSNIFDIDSVNGQEFARVPLDDAEVGKFTLREGDILYSESSLVRAGIAKSVYVTAEGAGTAFAWHTRRVSVDRTMVHPACLYFFLETPLARKQITSVATQTALTGITTRDYFATVIVLPSLPEQKKIAAFLGAVDAKIAALRERRAALERYKRGLMQALFSQSLRFTRPDGTAFPDWEEKRLGDLGRFIGGGTPDTNISEYWSGEIPWISSSDVVEGDLTGPRIGRWITEAAIKESATKVVPAGSILIVSRVGVGKLTVATCDLCTSQDFTNFIPKSDNVMFLGYWMVANTNALLRLCQGTSIKGLTSDDLKTLQVPIPHPDEQAKIAEALSAMDAKIAAVGDQVAQMEAFKKGLLQQMFV